MIDKYLNILTKKDVDALTITRVGEVKIGQAIQTIINEINWQGAVQQSAANYVLIGIAEDMGIKANFGKGGAKNTWNSFLPAFLNMQSNHYYTASNILLLGSLNFDTLAFPIETNAQSTVELTDAYRHALSIVDDTVETLVQFIVECGKIPLVIGGGHNNAYPLIIGSAKGLEKQNLIALPQINAINLDAHTDFRKVEGRHSGNGFRYAEVDGFLAKYAVLPIQEALMPEYICKDVQDNPFIRILTYEQIFLEQQMSYTQALSDACTFVSDNYCGIELDVDAIADVSSSAQSPNGVSVLQAREYIVKAAAMLKPAYFHLCEAAILNVSQNSYVPESKLLAQMIIDFCKTRAAIS